MTYVENWQRRGAGLSLVLGIVSGSARAQTQEPPNPAIRGFFSDVLRDEKSIFTSPAKVKSKDLWWLIPLGAGTGFLLASDERNMQERIKMNAVAQSRSRFLSDAGLGSLVVVPGAIYWWGWRHGDDYAMDLKHSRREGAGGQLDSGGRNSTSRAARTTGIWDRLRTIFRHLEGLPHFRPCRHLRMVNCYRTGEKVSGLAVASGTLRYCQRRQPEPDNGERALSVGCLSGKRAGLAHRTVRFEKRRREPELWLEGRRPTILAATPEAQVPSIAAARNDDVGDASSSSSYVPMDSWVYDALDRLAAFGLIPSQTSGLRPWTRVECRRQMTEADAQVAERNDTHSSSLLEQANSLLAALHREFAGTETGHGQIILDSLYVRNGVIAGPPLNDGYHFGQTSINDFGRPYGRGWNSIEGFQTHAEWGRFFAYMDGEYQHAPGQAADSLATRELIAELDDNPLQAPQARPATNRFRTIEAYAGFRMGNFEFSAGKQSLYWGPTYDAPLSFSDNAEPTKNAKISMVQPIRLPGILRYLGEIRAEIVVGKLGGEAYTWRPWFNAQKLTFKLTENLELGFTRWSEFGGVGNPITLATLWANLTTLSSHNGSPGNYPGEVKGAFDFRYRVPGLRNWLTLYSDSWADDDPSPLAAPRRAAISPGIYLSHVPGAAKLDFRVEAPSTMLMRGDFGGYFDYYNSQYHSSNTNYGYLIGNPVGRDGRAIEGWSTYHFSPRRSMQVGYRQLKVGASFFPGAVRNRTPLSKGRWHCRISSPPQ